jgi:methanogenic corrinoid protein MtbC1
LNQLEQFEKALLSVDRISAKDIFSQYLNEIDVMKGVQELIAPCLESIGAKWSKGEISLAQVYMSGRITEELVDLILPPSTETNLAQPNIAITTLDDFHFLGKRIVYSILRSNGFKVMDFGRKDVKDLVKSVEENKIQILLVSVLMLNSALKIKELKTRLDEQDIALKIIVGGAPFRMDVDLWHQVGADASGINASDSIKLVTDFIAGSI